MGNHFVWHLLGVPGTAAGAFLIALPVWGTWAGIADGTLAAGAWRDALPWVIPGLILFFGKRGVSVGPGSAGIRLWIGFALTRFLVLPLWRRRPRVFQSVLIRMASHYPPKGGLPTRQPAVYLLDDRGGMTLVDMAWTHRGAVAIAERLARPSGLPIG